VHESAQEPRTAGYLLPHPSEERKQLLLVPDRALMTEFRLQWGLSLQMGSGDRLAGGFALGHPAGKSLHAEFKGILVWPQSLSTSH
jgi:hypothetical protein